MIGKPKYQEADIVAFMLDGKEKTGFVFVVDAYGTFEQNDEPSYDVLVKEDNCLYKHVRESKITRKVEAEG